MEMQELKSEIYQRLGLSLVNLKQWQHTVNTENIYAWIQHADSGIKYAGQVSAYMSMICLLNQTNNVLEFFDTLQEFIINEVGYENSSGFVTKELFEKEKLKCLIELLKFIQAKIQ